MTSHTQVPNDNPPKGCLLSVYDAAERVGLHHVALRGAIKRGELPAVKLCSRLRIDPADLEAWISAGRVDWTERTTQ
jgi:excisionase family DNA binding protein